MKIQILSALTERHYPTSTPLTHVNETRNEILFCKLSSQLINHELINEVEICELNHKVVKNCHGANMHMKRFPSLSYSHLSFAPMGEKCFTPYDLESRGTFEYAWACSWDYLNSGPCKIAMIDCACYSFLTTKYAYSNSSVDALQKLPIEKR